MLNYCYTCMIVTGGWGCAGVSGRGEGGVPYPCWLPHVSIANQSCTTIQIPVRHIEKSYNCDKHNNYEERDGFRIIIKPMQNTIRCLSWALSCKAKYIIVKLISAVMWMLKFSLYFPLIVFQVWTSFQVNAVRDRVTRKVLLTTRTVHVIAYALLTVYTAWFTCLQLDTYNVHVSVLY